MGPQKNEVERVRETVDLEWSPGNVLAATLIASALPLLVVRIFPQLRFEIAPPSYLLFHNIVEFFGIMVSLSMFGLGWYTYDQSKDRHALFLSTTFLGIGLMDFMHTLANAAMPPFVTPNSSNKSTQFWIAVRLFQAVAFLVSAYVYSERPNRWVSKKFLLGSVLFVSFLVFSGITFLPAYMPDTFIPGTGLTPFKRISEYLVIGMLCAATLAYWRRMERTGDRLLIYYMAALLICIFSELSLAVYTRVFDSYNVLGHVYKVAAFYLIYHGVYRASAKAPYIKLTEIGKELRGEIAERNRTEEALHRAHDHLELRVEERTAELSQSNARLRTEIEDRRNAEEALREAHAQLRGVLDATQESIWVFSPEGIILLANQTAIARMKKPAQDLMGKRVEEVVPPELAKSRLARLREVVESCRPIEFEDERAGMRFHHSFYPVLDGDGVTSVVSFSRDITERKQAEEALKKAHALLEEHSRKLEESNKALEGFAYSISHDLRAPLRAINGFARMLADDYGPSLEEEGRRRLGVIEQNAIKMGQLIEDLLSFSRAAQTAVSVSGIDMNSLVADVIAMLKASVSSPRPDIHVGALPEAKGDPVLIRQVLANLIENAIKFSRKRLNPRIEVGSLEREGGLVYFVKDNGLGFEMKYSNKLFGVFQRLVTTDEFEGTGVGLAIVHRIITRHGGKVWAEAEPGEGATFFFTLKK